MLETLKNLHWGIQFLLMLVLAGAFFYGFDYLVLTNVSAETKQKQIELDKLKAENQTLNSVKARLSEFQARGEQLKVEYEQSALLLPEEAQVSRILESVQAMAKEKLLVMSFKSPEKKDDKNDKNDKYKDLPIKVKHLPVEVNVLGTYPRLQDFFQRMASLPRIINISDVSLASTDKQNEKVTLRASFTVSALYAEPEGGSPQNAEKKNTTPAASPSPIPAKN
jgi:Tfp pilus assembly protein PilO